MTEGNAASRSSALGVWLRLALYCVMLPSMVIVPFELGRSQAAVATVIAGVSLCAIGAAIPRSRRAVAAAFARSRVLRGVDALLFNVAVVLAIGEVVLAVAGRVTSSPLLVSPNASAQTRIAEQRNHVFEYFGPGAGNRHGHNDTEPLADATGVVRIVALGDSFAYGIVGYDHNFLTLLEQQLGERVGRPVEVVNLGLPSLQPREYLQLLVDEGMPLHPDLVLVCLFAGNDFHEEGETSPLDARNWRLVGFVSRLVRYAQERARSAAPAAPALATHGSIAPAGGFSEEAYRKIATSYVQVLRKDLDKHGVRAYRDTLAIVDEIVATATPLPVVLAVLPDEVQVSPPLREAVLADLALPESALELDRPARETQARYAKEARVTVVDLLPALVESERGGRTYAVRDSHWNERGNGVAAQVLADALEPAVRRIAEQKGKPQ